MKIDEIKELIKTKEYDFLRTNEHLKDRIILLGLGGSYAYGTNTETSDIDIRGCALNSLEDILFGSRFDQVVDEPTDTTIYSFNKLIHLLMDCNPNTIEILGLKPEHYIFLNDDGRMLLNNKKMFISKRCIKSFMGYASDQFYRLQNHIIHLRNNDDKQNHILERVKNANKHFKDNYFEYDEDNINLYIDKAVNKDYDTEIFMDINLKHYPLRDYKAMWNQMRDIVKSYDVIGKRNANAISHNKLGKHMMHLIRLYLMCIDLLEKEDIITYRENEHDMLMDIRNNKYLDENGVPIKEFFDMVESYKSRLEYAIINTSLPEKPDLTGIKEMVMSINYNTVVFGN
jgi:predicted nucleotidyltransferase